MKIKNIKTILFSCLILGLVYFALDFFYFEKGFDLKEKEDDKQTTLINSDEQEVGESSNNSEINLFFVGDIMLDRGVEINVDKYGNGDFRFPFLKIVDELKKSDILFGNLEGPISDKGIKVGSMYSFRFRPETVDGLLYAGFDILSLANNHMLDYQRIALEDTMNILEKNGIDYIGAGFNKEETFSLRVKEIAETKIGFLAYTDLGPENWRAGDGYAGMSWIGQEGINEVNEKVKESKKIVDILVVSLHSGKEYSQDPTLFQIFFAESCINNGADLVIGHHPHVVQKVEKYNDGWIAYSLGNFVFDQSFSEETMESVILKVKVKNKKIQEIFSEKLKINEYSQPELISDN